VSLLLVPLLPLAAALLSLLPAGRRLASAATLLADLTALALAGRAALAVAAAGRLIAVPGWVELDGLGALLLALSTFVAVTAALFSWGYVGRHEHRDARARLYYFHFNLFTFALLLVPVLAEPALTWIAIEFTAVFSVLLVAFDDTHESLEAAWKYIALMFMGAAIALLGFFILFWAQQTVGGGEYSWAGLRLMAARLPLPMVTAAFVLVLIGFGTKAGIVPLHTWLPDAHSQAPSPVCALLSGVKTTTALYALLRLVPLLPVASVDAWLRIAGLVSVGVAAFLLIQVRDYKRLFAYSTVEHMGIVLVGVGLGGPAATYAAMLQLVNHGLTKAFCFLAAGAVLLALGTREIASVRGLIRSSPSAGAALLFGALAIGGAPPFALFLSEFSIFRAGLEQRQYVVTALLVAFITIAFFAILLHVNRMVFGPAAEPAEHPSVGAKLPASALAALAVAAVPVAVLGLYQPGSLHVLATLAASSLLPVSP